jgi:hypothetical protein
MKVQADSRGKLYIPGNKVPTAGIYEARHHRHRLPHEATLLEGEFFPPCRFCGASVRFRLLRGATSAEQDQDFTPHAGNVMVG